MQLDRRTLLVLGAVSTAPMAAPRQAAASERYAPDEGTELAPGIRQVDISEQRARIPGYSRVAMRDIVIEPGASIDPFPMENDMVCHMLEGELALVQNGEEFTARQGDVWTCAVGTEEGGHNTSDQVAIMRITDLYA